MPCSASSGRRPRANCAGMTAVERLDLLGDGLQDVGGGEAVGAAGVDPGVDLVVHAGHADHEELVQVGGEDGQELQPLDQRQRFVLGQSCSTRSLKSSQDSSRLM